MAHSKRSSRIQSALTLLVAFGLGVYFTFHAIQGDYGLFSRVQVEAEEQRLEAELALLRSDLAALRNKTRRLSDGYLDLDLLDQQAREILGYARSDEVIIQ